jgi:poly-gamma-glutamate capsule biosynthesis protein CapA/YwtB (metallophosphatase superfamily)
MVRILIGGDICPIGHYVSLFEQGDTKTIFNDLLPEFENSDVSIANLECPLVLNSLPIKKVGPVLGVPSQCINGFKNADINVLNLANNHIMDHGISGLLNTISVCNENNIDYVGAGKDLKEAGKIYVTEVQQIRIGIASMAEHEFSIAGRKYPGANPLDYIEFIRRYRAHRNEFDYLVVLLHSGNENYPYPSPELMKRCRFFVEEGASAVICQHSHCPGCYEIYKDSPIVYGQGNLIFEEISQTNKTWHEGFLVGLEIEKNHKPEMKIIPYTQSEMEVGARRMDSFRESKFLEALKMRSEAILDDEFVWKKWNEFCCQKRNEYLYLVHRRNKLSAAIYKMANKLSLNRYLYSKSSLLLKLNLLRCESHREALIDILSDKSTQ